MMIGGCELFISNVLWNLHQKLQSCHQLIKFCLILLQPLAHKTLFNSSNDIFLVGKKTLWKNVDKGETFLLKNRSHIRETIILLQLLFRNMDIFIHYINSLWTIILC